MSALFPISLQFAYHPDSTVAEETALFIHNTLNADPTVPGLSIPTIFPAQSGSCLPPPAELAAEAEKVAVVLLADDHLAAGARQGPEGNTWGDYVANLRASTDASAHCFIPIQLTRSAYPIDPRLEDLNFLRAWAIDDVDSQRTLIVRRLVHLLIRQLRSEPEQPDSPPVTIFLSHTKIDIEREPWVVKLLLAHLTASQPAKTWFDGGDIATGSKFAKAIESGIRDTALLAVITDAYSSRSWCRREVLLAKHHARPVVIVDAVQEGEVRRFPYSGNAPVIRWKGEPEPVVDLLLREVLRHEYSRQMLEARSDPEDDLMSAGPELLTLINRTSDRPVLYPDPPLGLEELAILESTGVTVETPLERHARRNSLARVRLTVGLSVSEAEDIRSFGLRSVHLDTILLEISRYLLVAGVQLSYGGHLGPEGYTTRLADLLRDPVIQQLRGAPPDGPNDPQLVNYLPWPSPRRVNVAARLGPLVSLIYCQRPDGVDEKLDPLLKLVPDTDVPCDSPERRFAISRGLTEMRLLQAGATDARVLVGGRLGSAAAPYRGRMPGVLEEGLLSLRARKPTYLVGAFGGCAKLILDELCGIHRAELNPGVRDQIPLTAELRQLYGDRRVEWTSSQDIRDELASCGLGGLNNGLTDQENIELGKTRSSERIVQLILLGLQRCSVRSEAGSDEDDDT